MSIVNPPSSKTTGKYKGFCELAPFLPPQLLEPGRIAGGVADGVLNVAVPEIVPNEPRIYVLVGDRLREKGFEVVPQVGVAGYFIDLAVKPPKHSGFVLGIECDGAGYHSSRSACNRDRLRQQVLERLQWNIYRIWLTDWLRNPEELLGRLLRRLDALLQNDL